MNNEIKKYLFDIHESIESIYMYLAEEGDFFKYLDNEIIWGTIIRHLPV